MLRPRSLAVPVAAALLALGGPGAPAEAERRPNIVVVVTDDQTLASLDERTMPGVTSVMEAGGTDFENAVVTTPVCCPSRATLLTGQYAHNHGTVANAPGYAALRNKRNTLPVWLRRAGYRTAHVGKYLNRYARSVDDPAEAPPGWRVWHTLLDGARRYVRYYRYRLAVNGRAFRVGERPRDYVTRTINRRAARVVRRHVPKRRPLYLQIDHRAPHVEVGANSGGRCGGLIPPDPRDAGAFASEPLPRPPSFDEEDVADKPSFMRVLPRIGAASEARIELRYQCALASLRSVDRGFSRIVRQLRRAGELDDTVLVFTSDNGFFFGEHRIPEQKTRPYEEALRVPLLIRVPSRHLASEPAAPLVPDPVSNVDLAPTLLDLARARPCRGPDRCRVLDGRSLTPLIRGEGRFGADRAIVVEFDAGTRARPGRSCRYQGVRVGSAIYLRHAAAPDPLTRECRPIDEVEHYDLASDPYQLDNLHAAAGPPQAGPTEAALDALLDRLRDCAGIGGRDPAPLGRSHCE